jgi:hypothetical protein
MVNNTSASPVPVLVQGFANGSPRVPVSIEGTTDVKGTVAVNVSST